MPIIFVFPESLGKEWVQLLLCVAFLAGAVSATPAAAALPDLILWGPAAKPRIVSQTFTSNSCEVLEGCATPGAGRYLVFDTETRNLGPGDLYLGNPIGNPLFEFDACHQHYHFRGFADYQLVNSAGATVTTANKVGFCLTDTFRWSPNTTNLVQRYTCENQGLQAGWADIYVAALPCQWVDITTVPPGAYRLELEADPENRIAEADESNNVARVTVVIDAPCAAAPENDDFVNAQIFSGVSATVLAQNTCASRQASEPAHVNLPGSASVWYRWTAPYSGPAVLTTADSSFDTLLAVYTGEALTNVAVVAANDDNADGLTSRVMFAAEAGTEYRIAVDGFNSARGGLALHLNPGANDHFADAQVLTGQSGFVLGRNEGVSLEAGEPWHAGKPGGRSVWFRWTALSSRLMSFNSVGSTFDTVLAIYAGAALDGLAPVASDNDAGPNKTSVVTFDARAGETYQIALDGVGGSEGIFRLNWGTPPRLGPVALTLGNGVQLTVHGEPGQRWALQTSSNLVEWTLLTRLTNTTEAVQFTDSVGAQAPARFYRCVVE